MKHKLFYSFFSILFIIVLLLLLKPFYTSSTINNFKPVNLPSASYSYNNILNDAQLNFDTISRIFYNNTNLENLILIDRIADNLISETPNNPISKLQIFSTIFNERNAIWKVNSLTENTLDTLFKIFIWANNFKSLSVISNKDKAAFYNVIYDYWMTEIVRNLEKISQNDSNLRYTVKFKVISSLCENGNYSPNYTTSHLEKILYNVENSRYNYILGRYYLVFGIFGMILILFLLGITLYSYTLLFGHIKNYFSA